MKHLLTITFILLITTCYAQSPRSLIRVNNSDPIEVGGGEIKIKAKDKVEFLMEVNPFVYDVTIGFEKVEYDFEVPEVIQKYLIDFNSIGSEDSVTLAFKNEVEGAKNSLQIALGNLQQLGDIENNLRYLVQDENLDLSSILLKKNEVINKVEILCERNQDCSLSMRNYFNNALNELAYGLKSILDDPSKIDFNKVSLGKLMKLKVEVDEGRIKEQIESLIKFYSAITPDKWYPRKNKDQVSGDELKIVYELKQKDNLVYTPRYSNFKDSVRYTVRYWPKIDFSSGIFVGGMSDQEFSTTVKSNDGDTTQIIAMKNDDNFEIAVGGLVHVYMQSDWLIKPSISLGAMVNNSERVRYLLGAGLIIGAKSRIILNGGLSIGKVQRLAKHQAIGDEVSAFDQVQLIEKARKSWFLGITYNL